MDTFLFFLFFFCFVLFCYWRKLYSLYGVTPIFSFQTKKVREKSRECHNHKPQPFLDTRGKGNRQIQTSTNRSNIRKASVVLFEDFTGKKKRQKKKKTTQNNRKHIQLQKKYLSGVWNYQILLLVHGQVNGQNPFVQPRFTCRKIVIFSYFSKKTYVVGTH